MAFKLIQGISAENLDGVESAYSPVKVGLLIQLSAELIGDFLTQAVPKLHEKVFFFLELPCTEQEEKRLRKSKNDPYHYNLYYLDNCTLDVAMAVLDVYGDLLINDGLCRFGFGSHELDEEVYVTDFQIIMLRGKLEVFEPIVQGLGVPCVETAITLEDNFSPETPAETTVVEIDGVTVFDIPELLKPAGMYLAYTYEENF